MRIYATSDLHLDFEENRRWLEDVAPRPKDCLIIAGDVGHDLAHLELALQILGDRFARIVWIPGNHDLWTVESGGVRGEAKYLEQVELCKSRGVLTPEDDYLRVECGRRTYVIAPLFLLYDYTFRPLSVAAERVVDWAAEANSVCADEHYLSSAPYPSISDWCAARCEATERRLAAVPRDLPLVLANHFPLRRDLIWIAIPRFSPWCGTRRTEDWHTRFNVEVVVSGHLHVPRTQWCDGVRFEEVSLGYPRQWRWRPAKPAIMQVLPSRV